MGFGSWFGKKKLSEAEINELIADLLFGMVMLDRDTGEKEIDYLIKILSKRTLLSGENN